MWESESYRYIICRKRWEKNTKELEEKKKEKKEKEFLSKGGKIIYV